MKQVGRFKTYASDEVPDWHFRKIGMPRRDEFEQRMAVSTHAYKLGEAVKKARIGQNLTQEGSGERTGVKRAQISRLEKGYSISTPIMSKVFKALDVPTASTDLGKIGRVVLW